MLKWWTVPNDDLITMESEILNHDDIFCENPPIIIPVPTIFLGIIPALRWEPPY